MEFVFGTRFASCTRGTIGAYARIVSCIAINLPSDIDVWKNHSFLNDLDRILSPSYDVSDGNLSRLFYLLYFLTNMVDDVVRARLRTMGIQEHFFRLELDTGSESYCFSRALSFH